MLSFFSDLLVAHISLTTLFFSFQRGMVCAAQVSISRHKQANLHGIDCHRGMPGYLTLMTVCSSRIRRSEDTDQPIYSYCDNILGTNQCIRSGTHTAFSCRLAR